MSQPNRASTHMDKVLTDFSLLNVQNESVFQAGMILPFKAVSKQSDKYLVYDKDAFARDDVKLRAAGTESNGTGFSLSSDSYYCDKYSVHADLSYDEINEADVPLDLERDAAFLVAQQMLQKRERLAANAIFKTGVWALDVDGAATTKWSDYLASDPIAAIDSAARSILLGSFNNPSTLVLGLDVFNALKSHPDLNRSLNVTGPQDEAGIARHLGVSRIIVPRAIGITGNEGKAGVAGFIWNPKSALLLSNPMTVGLRTPAAGMIFGWTGAAGAPRPGGFVTRRLEMPETQSVRIESDMTIDVKITGREMGVYFDNIVA